jgi:hypothetical protein
MGVVFVKQILDCQCHVHSTERGDGKETSHVPTTVVIISLTLLLVNTIKQSAKFLDSLLPSATLIKHCQCTIAFNQNKITLHTVHIKYRISAHKYFRMMCFEFCNWYFYFAYVVTLRCYHNYYKCNILLQTPSLCIATSTILIF